MARALGKNARGFVLAPAGADVGGLPAGMEVVPGDHPVPSVRGLASSRRIMTAVARLGEHERLLYMISGGTSALFEVPCTGLVDADTIATYELLLGCGAPIEEINVVRRRLSLVKGGGLARAAYPARVLTLAVSDVDCDDQATIGSGPTVDVCDPSDAATAVLERHGLIGSVPAAVREAVLARHDRPAGAGRDGGGPAIVDGYEVLASSGHAGSAAGAWLRSAGYALQAPPVARLRGDVEGAAVALAAGIRALTAIGGTSADPAFVVTGETTVRLPAGAGRGGRNLHLAALLARELAGCAGFACMVGGTDGADGSSGLAGAVVDGAVAARARDAGHDLEVALAGHATAEVLEAAGAAVATNPTGTNVGDLVVATASRRRQQ